MNNIEKIMSNIEKTKVYYENANKLANSIYELFDEALAEIPIVVYCVNVNRWYDRVDVGVWATIGEGKANDEFRKIVGYVNMDFSFSEWNKEDKASVFLNEVKKEIKPFIRRAKVVQEIVNENKEQ